MSHQKERTLEHELIATLGEESARLTTLTQALRDIFQLSTYFGDTLATAQAIAKAGLTEAGIDHIAKDEPK